MKRLLILMTLSGLAMACGDDDGDDDKGPAVDAGTDAKVDSSVDASVAVKVTNVGAACAAPATCTGAAATCATSTPLPSPFPGGYCSAACTTSAECGSEGACPLGELKAIAPDNPMLKDITGQCWQKCAAVGGPGCRAGYICTTLGATIRMDLPIPPLKQAVCLPAIPLDAGVGDSGVADASGIDAAT